MHEKRNRAWAAYCREMAEATYTLADKCADPELLRVYIGLGAEWVNMGIDANLGAADLRRLAPANRLPV